MMLQEAASPHKLLQVFAVSFILWQNLLANCQERLLFLPCPFISKQWISAIP